MNKEDLARGGERIINEPGGKFEVVELKRCESNTLRATIQDIDRKKEFCVDVYFDGKTWKAKTEIGEYALNDVETIEQLINNAINDETIIECDKLGLELIEADYFWNMFLFSKREDVKPEPTIKAKIVNTGITPYIEFEKHLQGFKDGEVLTYRKCQDGTAVIVKGIEND